MAQKIGMLTLPLHINYGGILQCAALAQFLIGAGKDVVLLERAQSAKRQAVISALRPLPFLGALARWTAPAPPSGHGAPRAAGGLRRRAHNLVNAAIRERKVALHRPFIARFIPAFSGSLQNTQEMTAATRRLGLDAVVVGSDQVWRPDYVPNGAIDDYFLGFAEGTPARRVSYAASFGTTGWEQPALTARIRALLDRFDAVSVRETSGVAVCRDVFGLRDVRHVLDPTMLVDMSFYEAAAAAPGDAGKKVVLQYVLDQSENRAMIAQAAVSSLGEGHVVRSLTLDVDTKLIDVGTWLRAFMDAEFVITDSFHGMVFAILFRKNFIAVVNRSRGEDRFRSLLAQLDLPDRLMDAADAEQARRLAETPIDFDAVHARIARLRESSAAFLLDALR